MMIWGMFSLSRLQKVQKVRDSMSGNHAGRRRGQGDQQQQQQLRMWLTNVLIILQEKLKIQSSQ